MSNLEFSEKELAAIRAEYCKGFTEVQAEVCLSFCRVRNLIPGKHVLFQLRNSKEWDETVKAKVPVTKIVFMTTIDAARLIASRSGQYDGQDPEVYIYLDENGSPSVESSIPLPQTPLLAPGITPLPREPWAVRSTVYRKDFSRPMISVARFDAYASSYNTANGVQLSDMWVKRGAEQLAKCSEMLSLRKTFPEELGSLYISEEFKHEEEDRPKGVTPASITVSLPPAVPAVNQQPATGVEAPRPGEAEKELLRETLPIVEKLLENPEFNKKLEAEGKQIGQAAIDQMKKDVGLKTASELPTPKRRGRQAKPPHPESPVNGQPVDKGITDEDLDQIGKETPEANTAENQREAQEFVEAVTSFTPTEAAAQGLPDPGDQAIPEGQTLKNYVARIKALEGPGVDRQALGAYTLGIGGKTSSKFLTVGDWNKALTALETAKAISIDALKELVKNAPAPPF